MAGLVSGVVSVHSGDDGNTHSGISLAGHRILVGPSGTDTAISTFYRVPAHNQPLRTHVAPPAVHLYFAISFIHRVIAGSILATA